MRGCRLGQVATAGLIIAVSCIAAIVHLQVMHVLHMSACFSQVGGLMSSLSHFPSSSSFPVARLCCGRPRRCLNGGISTRQSRRRKLGGTLTLAG